MGYGTPTPAAIDICAWVDLLSKDRGEVAEFVAAGRADALLDQGDAEGSAFDTDCSSDPDVTVE